MPEKSEQSLKQSLLSQTDEHHQQVGPSLLKQRHLTKLSPINGRSILQSVLFTWVFSLVSYGSRESVTVDSMPDLPAGLKTTAEYEKVQTNFDRTQRSSKEGATLSKAIFKSFCGQFSTILIALLIMVSITMLSPYLTAEIMRFIQNRQDYQFSYGVMLFVIILVSTIVRCLFETQMMYRFTVLGINLTNSLTMMIYCKSLKYASVTEKQFSESDIINYSQVDAERMTYMGFQLAALLVAPIQIIVGVLLMYFFIGVSFVSGIVTMLVMILCTFFLSKKAVALNEQVLKAKDARMKVTQEMLDVIRFIKINAIEKFFYRKLDDKRSAEIQLYRRKGLVDVLTILVYWLACPIILSATFVTYVLLGNEMNSQVAFTTIMIFTSLQYPIRLVPTAISELIQIYSSIKRIEKYLLTEEISTEHFQQIDNEECLFAVKIDRGNFYWGVEKKEDTEKDQKQKKKGKNKKNKKEKNSKKKGVSQQSLEEDLKDSLISDQQSEAESQISQTLSSINDQHSKRAKKDELQRSAAEKVEKTNQKPKYTRALKDISTTIQKGKFNLLIGDIGSGKSSLLLAILNEMRCSPQTNIQINGSIAYASQKPWIMSATVKQNITFSLPFDEFKFNNVIHFASLARDLQILPKGVETQIGQKGVNLSGGQKARISLARALYSQKDIYLLDDVLSAVDVHVGDFLMKQTLLGYLKGKTIIMPTHAVKYAEAADEIIVMKKGRIVRKGNYRDISKTEEFEEIYMKQKAHESDSKQEEGIDSMKEIETEFAMMRDVLKHKSDDHRIDEVVAVADKLIQEMMLPEDHVVGKVDFNIFREYIDLNGGLIRFALLVTIAMLFWVIFTTSASVVMEHWCQDPIGQFYDLYIYIGLSVLSNVFIFFRAYTLILSGAKQGEKVHRSMIKSLLYASLGDFYNRIPIGRIVNRLTKDLRQLDEVVGFAIGNLLVCIFQLLGTLTICIYGSSPLILIPMAIVAYFTHKIRNYYMKTQRQVARYEKSTNSPIVSGFMSAISGLSSIRAYQKQTEFIGRQIEKVDLNKKVRLNKSALQSWFSIHLTYLSLLVNMAAIGYCILSENDNASLAGLLMNYALSLSEDIINFTLAFAYFQTKLISLERIYNFMKIEPEQLYAQYCLAWQPAQQGYTEVVKSGSVQFIDLFVRYRKDLPDALKGINCKILPGQKIGIVGRTGAGKTTIINTLLRIAEISRGQLLIDGQPIDSYSLKDLRNGITMIDQEPTLIKSTFKENLDITGNYSNEELLSILKECNLYETITEKGGLQGSVSNDSLSAGEKQLLCICRAFLKHSKIVLIDEATANIDMKNDEIIQRVISDKFKNCTVLTIAHRLSTLKNSDKIIVMQGGNIIQFGSPSELQSKPQGFFREMVLKNASEFLT